MENNSLNEPFYSSAMVNEIYHSDNILYKRTKAHNHKAIIFFSGNGLYYPNTTEVFEEKIKKSNYYEWINLAEHKKIQKYYSLIVFVRDVNKCWYAKGINNIYDTRDKVVEKLSELLGGYQITTCGNSAGGYMAVYAGIKLNAERIFNFSGQYDLEISDKQRIERYYNEQIPELMGIMNANSCNVYYFFPYHCKQDKQQYNLVKHYEKIKIFRCDERTHGATIMGNTYPYILVMKNNELNKLASFYNDKIINKMDLYNKLHHFYQHWYERLFSIKNNPSKTRKIITILGLQIKMKRKK